MHPHFDSVKEIKEYHNNGQLAYEETIAVLLPMFAPLHSNRRTHPDGYDLVRIGTQTKWFDNGQMAWQLSYSETGDYLSCSTKYRKDGTTITD